MINKNYVCIVGGAGHVGLPLGLAISAKGYNVSLIDKNIQNIKKINNAKMPFIEDGCKPLLKKMITKRKISATNNLMTVKKCKYITKYIFQNLNLPIISLCLRLMGFFFNAIFL